MKRVPEKWDFILRLSGIPVFSDFAEITGRVSECSFINAHVFKKWVFPRLN